LCQLKCSNCTAQNDTNVLHGKYPKIGLLIAHKNKICYIEKKKKQLQQPGKYQVNFLPFSICQQGEMIMNYDENINIQDKLQHLDQLKTIYLQNKKNLLLDTSFVEKYQENFLVQYTYDSTSIEGNTLTKEETYSLLIDNRTPSN